MAEVQRSFDLHSIDPLILLGMNDSNLDVIQNNPLCTPHCILQLKRRLFWKNV